MSNGQDIIEPSSSSIGTIYLYSALPALTRPDATLEDLSIQGSAGGGSRSGSGSGTSIARANGLSIQGSGDAVVDFGVTGFGRMGIFVSAGAVQITQSQVVNNGGGGVAIWGSQDVVSGSVISGNRGDGVDIVGSAASDNLVAGNLIGLDAAGNAADGNEGSGIVISGASDNTIGGTTSGEGNVVSGNDGIGIFLFGSGTNDNLVAGNLVGTNATGSTALGNQSNGVDVSDQAADNTIGGTTGAGGNLISGNQSSGVFISDAGTTGNLVVGNLIGTNAAGTAALGDNYQGVFIGGGATSNTIGGAASGAANVISGNNGDGIDINNAGTSQNVVLGNFIGTDITGTGDLGNTSDGVSISDGASDDTIGGTSAGAGNVISGNGSSGVGVGIEINDSTNNLVINNAIGMKADLSGELGNGLEGISVDNDATANTIGGAGTNMGNRIVQTFSGFSAISIGNQGDGSNDNLVLGNTIGLNGAGTGSLGIGNGIYIGSSYNTVGGTTVGARNYVVGAQGFTAIWLNSSGSFDNLVEGNYVGTTTDGSTSAGGGGGIAIDSAYDNTIGGSATGAGNVISGNAGEGLDFQNAYNNVVAGNFIGTDATGSFAVANGSDGILLEQGSTNNTIGGIVAGVGNVISGNGGDGVVITGQGTSQNVVAGNFVGTDLSGTAGIGNSGQGIDIDSGATNNTIGGASGAGGNLVSGNDACGLFIVGTGTSGNVVEGDLVGTDTTGSEPLANAFQGVYFGPGTFGNTVGGATAGSGNVISANGNGGIWINGASDVVVEGNMIGTNGNGTLQLGNTYSGVYIDAGASNNTIGGTAENVISGNYNYGVVITGQGTNQNIVAANNIGTDVTGSYALGNSYGGVLIDSGAIANTIGGTTAGAGNIIAFNGGNGVTIGDNATDASTGDAVLGNSIFANALLGIDLGNDGVTLNGSEGHSGPNLFQDFPVLSSAVSANGTTTIAGSLTASPNTTYRVEFFSSVAADQTGYGQGQTFLTFASVTTDLSGQASFTVDTPTAVAIGQSISATATDPAGDTSEFSYDVTVVGPWTVSGEVYNDVNGSGTLENGDPGLAGWTVELTNTSTNSVYTTTTDNSGMYSLSGVSAGTYALSEVLQAGYIQTEPASPGTYTVTVSSGQTVNNLDFGDFATATFSGVVFNDPNGEATPLGIQSTFNSNDEGWQIVSFADLSTNDYSIIGVYTPTYNSSGGDPGGYISTTDPDNGDFTFSAPSFLLGNQSDATGLTYDLTHPQGAINYQTTDVMLVGDGMRLLWESNPPIVPGTGWTAVSVNFAPSASWHLNTTDGALATPANFQDVLGDLTGLYIRGEYTVGPELAGLDNIQLVGAVQPGLPGWTVQLLNSSSTVISTATTDSNGNYSFAGVGPGTFTIQEVTQPGYVATPPTSFTVTSSSGLVASGYNFGEFQSATLAGEVYNDTNGDGTLEAGEPGLSGWTVELLDASNEVVTTAVTDSTGSYTFANVIAGTYTVEVVQQSGYVPSSASSVSIDVTSGLNDSTLNFGEFVPVSLSGEVFQDNNGDGQIDGSDSGLSGWTVDLVQGSQTIQATTASGGLFSFSNVGPGTFTLEVVQQAGYVATNSPVTIVPTSGTNISGEDLGEFPGLTISGQVFDDVAGSGAFAAGDPGMAGWTIELVNSANSVAATATTDSSGDYTLAGILPGLYRVEEVLQTGYTETTAPAIYYVTMVAGQNLSGINFGDFQLATVSGEVFDDLNDDGNLDPGDPGLTGWTVELLNSVSRVVGTATTNASGDYSIGGVGPGIYNVAVVTQPGFVLTAPSSGLIAITATSGAALTGENFGAFKSVSLAVSDLTTTPASGLQSSMSIVVQWTDTNTGTQPADGSFSDQVVITNTTTGSVLATGYVLYNEPSEGELAAAQARCSSTTSLFPTDMPASARSNSPSRPTTTRTFRRRRANRVTRRR